MPARVSRTKAAAIVSKDGNKRGGNKPRCATVSHIAPSTMNGNALRAARRNGPASTAADEGTMSWSSTMSYIAMTIVRAVAPGQAPQDKRPKTSAPRQAPQDKHPGQAADASALQRPRPVLGNRHDKGIWHRSW